MKKLSRATFAFKTLIENKSVYVDKTDFTMSRDSVFFVLVETYRK